MVREPRHENLRQDVSYIGAHLKQLDKLYSWSFSLKLTHHVRSSCHKEGRHLCSHPRHGEVSFTRDVMCWQNNMTPDVYHQKPTKHPFLLTPLFLSSPHSMYQYAYSHSELVLIYHILYSIYLLLVMSGRPPSWLASKAQSQEVTHTLCCFTCNLL